MSYPLASGVSFVFFSQLILWSSGLAKLLRLVLFLLQKQTKNAPVRRHLPVRGAVLCAPSHHASG